MCGLMPQLLFRKFAVCDVLDLKDEVGVSRSRFAYRRNAPRCPHDPAVLMQAALLRLTIRNLTA